MTEQRYYDPSDTEVNKIVRSKIYMQWRRSDSLFDPKNGLIGKEDTFPIIEWDDTMKEAGDQITQAYNFQPDHVPGVQGRNKLEGKEVGIKTDTFSISIDKLRHGFVVEGEISQQRVPFSMLETARKNSVDWAKTRRAVALCNQVCGNVLQTDTRYTGNQAVTAVASGDVYRPGGSAVTTDELVQADTTLTFDADILDELVAIATQRDPEIKPFMVDGEPYYGFLAHPNQLADARKADSQFYGEWKAALQGGIAQGNPIFKRAEGLHGNVLIFRQPHLTRGLHSSTGAALANTRVGVFFGAGMAVCAYGRHVRNTKDPFKFYMNTRDHDDEAYTSISLISGTKVYTVPVGGTATRVGSLRVVTYAKDRISGQADYGQQY